MHTFPYAVLNAVAISFLCSNEWFTKIEIMASSLVPNLKEHNFV